MLPKKKRKFMDLWWWLSTVGISIWAKFSKISKKKKKKKKKKWTNMTQYLLVLNNKLPIS